MRNTGLGEETALCWERDREIHTESKAVSGSLKVLMLGAQRIVQGGKGGRA